jgi:hypothetical protein
MTREATELAIGTKSIEVTEYGIEFPGRPTLAEWKQAMLGLQKAQTRLQFYLGDMFIYAESAVTGWGQVTYDDLVAHSGYDRQTIQNFVWVARRFPSEFRKAIAAQSSARAEDCAFSHYAKVAALDDDQEAMRLLKMVGKAGWSCARLTEEVRKIKYGGKEPEDHPLSISGSRFQLQWLYDYVGECPSDDPNANYWLEKIGARLEAG